MIFGNNSTSEAVNLLLPQSISFTAPYDGFISSVSAHLLWGLNVTHVTIAGVDVNLSGFPQFTYRTVTATTSIPLTGGQTYSVQVTNPNPAGLLEVGGANVSTPDIWGTFDSTTPPATPFAPFIFPVSMSSWHCQIVAGNGGGPVDAFLLQRSQDGGASWTTIYTGPISPFVDTGVALGPLQYRTIAQSTNGSVTGPATTATGPSVIIAMTATALSMSSWRITVGNYANTVQYSVQRSSNGGAWTTISTQTTLSDFTDTAAPPGPLQYRVLGQNSVADAINGPFSAPVPSAPTAPAITQTKSSATGWNSILTWAAAPQAGGYRVERSLDGSFWVPLLSFATQTLTFIDLGVPTGIDLYYRIIALNSVGESGPGAARHWTRPAAEPAPTLTNRPLPTWIGSLAEVDMAWIPTSSPDNDVVYQVVERSEDGKVWVKISGSLGPTAGAFSDLNTIVVQIHVSWASVPLAVSYDLQRSADGLTWATISAGQTSLTYTDLFAPTEQYVFYRVIANGSVGSTVGVPTGIYVTGPQKLSICTNYIYRINTFNSVGETNGATSAITTSPPVLAIAASTSEDPLQIKLSFFAPTGLTPPYTVYRSQTGAPTLLAQTQSPEYTDTDITPGGIYFYRASSGIWTGPIVGLYAAGPVKPGAPTAQIDPLLPYVDIFWLPSYGAKSYGVERSIDGGLSYQSLASGLVGAFYVDSSPPMGNATQPIHYRIRASDTLYSAVSDDVTITLPVAPPPVPALSCLAGGIQVAWTGQAGSTGYDLQRSATKLLGDWVTITSPAAIVGPMSYLDTTAATYQRYYYRLVNKGTGGTKQSGLASSIVYKAPGSPAGYRIVVNGVDVSANIERGSNIRMNDEVTQKGAVASFRLVFDGATPKILTR